MEGAEVWRALRKHLDTMPVGFPPSPGGSGLRLLGRLFTEEHARVALGLDWRFATPAQIGGNLARRGLVPDRPVEDILVEMRSRGSVLYRETTGEYALVPLVVGMYEFQVAHLTREFLEDAHAYMSEAFAVEYLFSGEQQTRIIPVGEGVAAGTAVATYDRFRSIIEEAGDRIAVVECICRKAQDMLGKPCAHTERRELCMVFRDYADTVVREGWGRRIDRGEALEIALLNQKEGCVMRPSNERSPQFLCACCDDCCGLISMVKRLPRPADYVASGFRAAVAEASCIGCAACLKRCPMEALSLTSGRAKVSEARCIGCGLCVPSCRPGAIRLEPRKDATPPPDSTEELMERLLRSRPGTIRKYWTGLKAVCGVPRHRGILREGRRSIPPSPPRNDRTYRRS